MFFWFQDHFDVDIKGVSRIIGKNATKNMDLISWLTQQIPIINQVWKRYSGLELLRIFFPVWFFENFFVTAKTIICKRKWLIFLLSEDFNLIILCVIVYIFCTSYYSFSATKSISKKNILNTRCYKSGRSDHFICYCQQFSSILQMQLDT